MPKVTDSVSDQHARFIETARALGCNEDEAAFDEKLKTIVRHKPLGVKGQGADQTPPGEDSKTS